MKLSRVINKGKINVKITRYKRIIIRIFIEFHMYLLICFCTYLCIYSFIYLSKYIQYSIHTVYSILTVSACFYLLCNLLFFHLKPHLFYHISVSSAWLIHIYSVFQYYAYKARQTYRRQTHYQILWSWCCRCGDPQYPGRRWPRSSLHRSTGTSPRPAETTDTERENVCHVVLNRKL